MNENIHHLDNGDFETGSFRELKKKQEEADGESKPEV